MVKGKTDTSVTRLHGQLFDSECGVSDLADMRSDVLKAIDWTVEALCFVKRKRPDRVECSLS